MKHLEKDDLWDQLTSANNAGASVEKSDATTKTPPAMEDNNKQCEKQVSDNDERDACLLLEQYSLSGQSAELEADLQDEVFVLALIALLGQWTMVYSKPNVGKTLIVLWLLLNAINQKKISLMINKQN